MRYLIIASLIPSLILCLILCCGLCHAEDFPGDTRDIKSLTAEQAAELVATNEEWDFLYLNGLTSIDKDVAKELAKHKGNLYLNGLTSIDKDVAKELVGFKGWRLVLGLTSIDKTVAIELAKFKGSGLGLGGLESIDQDVLKILKTNPAIELPKNIPTQ